MPRDLDIIDFPDATATVVDFLTEETGVSVSSQLAAGKAIRHILVQAAGTRQPNMVTRRVTFTLEARHPNSEEEAYGLGSTAVQLLDAWCRLAEDDGPYDWELHSLIDSYPDPDAGTPRCVITCSMSFTGTPR